jgi:hypothetical protein
LRAALRELLETHFAVVATEVVVDRADNTDHLGFSICDFGFAAIEQIRRLNQVKTR